MIQSLRFKIVVICYGFLKRFQLRKGSLYKLSERLRLSILSRTDKPSWRIEIARNQGVKVGKNCRFYSASFFSEPYLIEIGNNVIISGRVIFLTHDGAVFIGKDEIENIQGHYGRIKIGNNCFIGMAAVILPNVEIGDNCIIGAGTIVNQSFPENSVVSGNPAKVIFKTSMYIKMKKNHKNTIINEKFPFPVRIPDNVKCKKVLEHFKNLDPPKPQVKKKILRKS